MAKLNEKYSYRDLSKRCKDCDFSKVPIEEINDTEIIGSGFGKGIPWDSSMFPEGMKGVTFIRCNLDNCVVPEGNTIGQGCTNKHHMVMNDGENWIVDKDLKPIEPLKAYRFDKYSLSKDPADIPLNKLMLSVTQAAQLASEVL